MIKIFTIVLILSVSLFARLNPFEPDTSYTTKTKETITQENLKPIPVKKPLISKDDGTRTVKVSGSGTNKVLLKEVEKTKVIVKEKIVKVKPTDEEIRALCKVQNNIPKISSSKSTKRTTSSKQNPIYVKEQTKIIKHYNKKSHGIVPRTYKILPFLTIDTDYNSLKIASRPQYHIIAYHVLKEKRKIAFDFLADVWFYTRYKKLYDAPKFEAYTVGNHKDKRYFRVTINLKNNIDRYTVTIKNNKATIKYK